MYELTVFNNKCVQSALTVSNQHEMSNIPHIDEENSKTKAKVGKKNRGDAATSVSKKKNDTISGNTTNRKPNIERRNEAG